MLSELDIAKKISDGELTSPIFCNVKNGVVNFSTQYNENSKYALLDLRVYRAGVTERNGELVYKPKEEFIADIAKEKTNGLPVIYEKDHPKDGVNNETKNIGAVFYPYFKNDKELWGIAKITDLIALAEIVDLYLQGIKCSMSSSIFATSRNVSVDNKTVSYEKSFVSANHVLVTPYYEGSHNRYDPDNNGINLTTYDKGNKNMSVVKTDNPDNDDAPDGNAVIEQLTGGLAQANSDIAELKTGVSQILEMLKANQAAPAAPVVETPPVQQNDTTATLPVETPPAATPPVDTKVVEAMQSRLDGIENSIKELQGEEMTENDALAEMKNDTGKLKDELADAGISFNANIHASNPKDYAMAVLGNIEKANSAKPLLSENELITARNDTSIASAYIKLAIERAKSTKAKVDLMPNAIKVTRKPINALTTEIQYRMDNPALLLDFFREPSKVQQVETPSF